MGKTGQILFMVLDHHKATIRGESFENLLFQVSHKIRFDKGKEMGSNQDYSINKDIKFGYSTIIDFPALSESCTDRWFNQTLCQVNDCVVRVGIIEGEFHWHKHEKEDEFFFVVEGKLFLDLEREGIELLPKQGYTVPKGVLHRTRAHERTVILMVEKDTIEPTGDS